MTFTFVNATTKSNERVSKVYDYEKRTQISWFFTFYPMDFERYFPFIWIAFFAEMRHFVTSDKNDRHIIFNFYN